tara:strand:+ start:96865 stop:97179 length:315 start_codon:yes stop_codon:yes gene_type:complete
LKYEYNEQTGEAVKFHGKPVPRHPKNPPLCQTPAGCPKGAPNKLNTLSVKNMQAYIHYLECKAVGNFPDDPIVRMNARLIKSVIDQAVEKKRIDELITLMGVRS